MHARRKKSAALAAAAALAGATLLVSAREARAAVHWVPVGAGCATAISVGPNNVPWILGCNGGNPNAKGPAGVYYLEYCNLPASTFLTYCTALGSTGVLVPYPHWQYDDFDAVTLSVSLNGSVLATDASGVPHWELANNGNPSPGAIDLPSGVWAGFGQGGVSEIAVGLPFVQIAGGLTGMLFYPAPSEPGPPARGTRYDQATVWGIGCGTNCQSAMTGDGVTQYESAESLYGVGPEAGGWVQEPGPAVDVAFFTDPPTSAIGADGSGTTQVAWSINTSGNVFYWSSGRWNYQPTPEAAAWITDHYILGRSGEVYVWNGTSGGGGNATWSKVIGPLAGGSNGIAMRRIAASQAASGAFVGQSAPIGPSALWGIDASGNVYSAQPLGVIQ
jgi:hypothetical protein